MNDYAFIDSETMKCEKAKPPGMDGKKSSWPSSGRWWLLFHMCLAFQGRDSHTYYK